MLDRKKENSIFTEDYRHLMEMKMVVLVYFLESINLNIKYCIF